MRICCDLFNGVIHYRTHSADVFRRNVPLLRLIDEKIIERFGRQGPSMATQSHLTVTPRTGEKNSIEGDRRDYSHSDLGIRIAHHSKIRAPMTAMGHSRHSRHPGVSSSPQDRTFGHCPRLRVRALSRTPLVLSLSGLFCLWLWLGCR